ncbi:MAG: hypothetical protein BAJALOKI1v1_70007 [Promethearchaeota archaeon]|nr:MAG: hypothetical protein BAJALOKI1v1_70007 [Candidatus Lokiarchaeota archaeon]
MTPRPTMVLEDGPRILAHVSGILLLALGISGLILSIFARLIRRTALHQESNNIYVKSAGIISILAIILNIIAIGLGGLFFYFPFYLSMKN